MDTLDRATNVQGVYQNYSAKSESQGQKPSPNLSINTTRRIRLGNSVANRATLSVASAQNQADYSAKRNRT